MAAVEEEKKDVEQEQEEIKENQTDVLEPSYTVRYITIGQDEHVHVYAQRPLSFFGKMELFSLLGESVNEVMRNGEISISDIFDAPETRNISQITASEIRETDVLIKAIAVIIQYVPDFLKDLYCIALAVPRGERSYIKSLMELPAEEGGLSDDDGIAVLDTFIEQNWEAMLDFFNEKILPLVRKVSMKAQNSASSKPLNRTQRRTRKR